MNNELLRKYLDKKGFTKIVCGAGNQNYEQIKNLVALYSAAGAKFFDINASIEAIEAYKEGISYSKTDDCLLCLSVGVSDDPHLFKYKINQEKCNKCAKCSIYCIQGAIEKNLSIDEKKCIGCAICKNACKNDAIEGYSKPTHWQENFEELKKYADCIEFHIVSENISEIDSKWEFLNNNFDGFLSISINRKILSDNIIIKQLNKMLSIRKPFTTIIQADGVAMSGVDNEYRTTLQAISMSDFISKNFSDTYIHTSGGTNAKTKELLDKFNINSNGIALGTYARKMVIDYINDGDFLNNKEKFDKALKIAKEVVASTK